MRYSPEAVLKRIYVGKHRRFWWRGGYDRHVNKLCLAAAPHRDDLLSFLPCSYVLINIGLGDVGEWQYTIDKDPLLVTALVPVVAIRDSFYDYHWWNLPAIPVFDNNCSTVFSSHSPPDNLLSLQEDDPGQSECSVSAGIAGFGYNPANHTLRTLHYILRIEEGGGLNEARFVWTKVPPKVPPVEVGFEVTYPTCRVPVDKLLYSEAQAMFLSGNTLFPVRKEEVCFSSDNHAEYRSMYLVKEGVCWAESRRRDPAVKDVFVFLKVDSDKRTVTVDEWPYLNSGERFFEREFHTDILQATWMNEKIIVLTDTDPMEIWEWDLDGTSTKLATTSIPQGSNVLLVAHPNQQYAYVFSEGEQWIIFSDLTLEAHALDLTGKVGFSHLCFDIDGYVWLDGLKLDPSTFDVLLDIPNARCNHTYVAVKNEDDTYSAFLLDGVTEIHNLDSDCMSLLFKETEWRSLGENHYFVQVWRYPQRVVVPYNETDLQLISKNGDLENAEWLGWDGSNWVPYDGTNARIIDNTHIELEDGVFVEFDFSTGDLVAGDYFYFTAGQALIKDDVSELSGTMLLSPYHYEEAYYDITLTTPTVELDNPDDPQYFWWYPDVAKQANWWGMLQQWLTATFDDPEQTGEGETAVIKFEGNPEPGEVVVDTNTGKFTFNAADYNRTFQVHFMWRVDVDCPFT